MCLIWFLYLCLFFTFRSCRSVALTETVCLADTAMFDPRIATLLSASHWWGRMHPPPRRLDMTVRARCCWLARLLLLVVVTSLLLVVVGCWVVPELLVGPEVGRFCCPFLHVNLFKSEPSFPVVLGWYKPFLYFSNSTGGYCLFITRESRMSPI